VSSKLWAHQVDALKMVKGYLASAAKGGALVRMPTGSGKTGIIACLAQYHSGGGSVSTGNAYDYQGPQRTPADPSKSNSNLYVLEPDPAAPPQTRVRQLTFPLNMERQPLFMNDGRRTGRTTAGAARSDELLAGRVCASVVRRCSRIS
jgi:hypothetical protein